MGYPLLSSEVEAYRISCLLRHFVFSLLVFSLVVTFDGRSMCQHPHYRPWVKSRCCSDPEILNISCEGLRESRLFFTLFKAEPSDLSSLVKIRYFAQNYVLHLSHSKFVPSKHVRYTKLICFLQLEIKFFFSTS